MKAMQCWRGFFENIEQRNWKILRGNLQDEEGCGEEFSVGVLVLACVAVDAGFYGGGCARRALIRPALKR